MSGLRTEHSEPIQDKYGTVDHHRAECTGCNLVRTEGPSYKDFKNLERFMGNHIGYGGPCHDYRIIAVYEDGGESNVA